MCVTNKDHWSVLSKVVENQSSLAKWSKISTDVNEKIFLIQLFTFFRVCGKIRKMLCEILCICLCKCVCVADLHSSVQRSTRKLVTVFGVEDDVHDVVTVTLKHLNARPLSLPVPQLDQHVI